MNEIAFRYVKENNPNNRFLFGIPLRDLTQTEFEALPAYQQKSVVASPFYQTELLEEDAALDEEE